MSANLPMQLDRGPLREDSSEEAPSLLDMMMAQANRKLDNIAEPSPEDLAALADLDDLEDIDTVLDEPDVLHPALSLLAELDEPELVSLESLDDVKETAALDHDLDEVDELLDEVDELLDDVESLIVDYIDVDIDDDELEDEGYDLDDDEFGNYRDLYGDDDSIIPSFSEGEFAEEEENGTAYYDDLR